VISEDGPTLPYCLGRDGALMGAQSAANEAFRHLPIRPFGDQFIGRRATPEVDPCNLEEVPRNPAEKIDQFVAIAPFSRFRSNAKQQLLKVLVRPWRTADSLGYDRAAN